MAERITSVMVAEVAGVSQAAVSRVLHLVHRYQKDCRKSKESR